VKRDEFEQAKTPDDHPDWLNAMVRGWLGVTAPEAAADPETLQWYVSYVARGASPAAVHAIGEMNFEIDVRHVLPTIRVPTLALHRSHESNREVTRYMAERIPGARLVELPGTAHLPWEGDADALLDEVDGFLGGVDDDPAADCVLSTLLFAELDGAAARAVPALLARFRGRAVASHEGSALAIFDGPARAVRCAAAIVAAANDLGLEARVGLHSGEIAHVDGGVRGRAVDVARDVAASAQPGEVLVSRTLKDILAGSQLTFREHGAVDGLPAYALTA
jgi:hypothetical protein